VDIEWGAEMKGISIDSIGEIYRLSELKSYEFWCKAKGLDPGEPFIANPEWFLWAEENNQSYRARIEKEIIDLQIDGLTSKALGTNSED
jgi:hypothetical protein